MKSQNHEILFNLANGNSIFVTFPDTNRTPLEQELFQHDSRQIYLQAEIERIKQDAATRIADLEEILAVSVESYEFQDT